MKAQLTDIHSLTPVRPPALPWRKLPVGPRLIAPKGTVFPPYAPLSLALADIASYEDADRRGCAGD
jgi:hypothetical protein